MKLARLALFLAVAIGTFTISLDRAGEYFGIVFPGKIHFVLYAPAMLLGAASWLTRPTLFASAPFVLWMTVPVIGLFYGESPAFFTKAVIVFYLLSGPLIASLIEEMGAWRWAARWFVILSGWLVVFVFFLNYVRFNGSLSHVFSRFGMLMLEDSTNGSNPNQMGGQLAVASIVGLILFFRAGRRTATSTATSSADSTRRLPYQGDLRGPHFGLRPTFCPVGKHDAGTVRPGLPSLGTPASLETPQLAENGARKPVQSHFSLYNADWPVVLATIVTIAGCLMTGSRGAALALIVAGFVVLLGSAGLQPLHRLRDMLALTLLIAIMLGLTTIIVGINPLYRIYERVTGEDSRTIATAGSRLPIWENGLLAWMGDPLRLLVGAGTAGADVIVGEVDPNAVWHDSGVLRRNAHSNYLEWLFSYGLAGIIPGLWFAGTIWLQAQRLDRRERTTDRRGLALGIMLFGATAVSYRHFSWPVEFSLLLAFLQEESLGQTPRPPSTLVAGNKNFPTRVPQLAGRSPAMPELGISAAGNQRSCPRPICK